MKRGLDRAITAVRNEDARAVDKLTKWLGVNSSNQQQQILGILIAARGLADSVTFACDMINDSNTFEDAVASAEGGHELLFTAKYFSYPEVGVISRPIIFFHEMTHLPDVANANSNGVPAELYKEDEVLQLATDRPDDARRNASNYHYFLGDFLYGN
ncbi:M35 family metallo-endopeptidase [Mesorhizobium sp. KR1-2]|uniref:M35 family metallo-endopeptidase n=1 Tax=Mesorhizobium sp. KR1-2 TaxID=3156609 RepID=UPI0032B581E9